MFLEGKETRRTRQKKKKKNEKESEKSPNKYSPNNRLLFVVLRVWFHPRESSGLVKHQHFFDVRYLSSCFFSFLVVDVVARSGNRKHTSLWLWRGDVSVVIGSADCYCSFFLELFFFRGANKLLFIRTPVLSPLTGKHFAGSSFVLCLCVSDGVTERKQKIL